MLFLLAIWYYAKKINRHTLIYSGLSMVGIAFLIYAIWGDSDITCFFGESLLQSGIAVFNVFLWTILGDLSRLYLKPFKIFSLGLAVNILSIFIGSAIGAYLLQKTTDYQFVTVFSVIASIFFSLFILPVINNIVEKDLAIKLNGLTDPQAIVDFSLKDRFGNANLTPREREIFNLIVQGLSNKDICDCLTISNNTLKSHTKNLYQKIGVANKRELLAQIISEVSSKFESSKYPRQR